MISLVKTNHLWRFDQIYDKARIRVGLNEISWQVGLAVAFRAAEIRSRITDRSRLLATAAPSSVNVPEVLSDSTCGSVNAQCYTCPIKRGDRRALERATKKLPIIPVRNS